MKQHNHYFFSVVGIFAAGAATLGQASAPLLSANAATMPAFHITLKGNAQAAKTGDFPPPWTGNLWDSASVGEIFRDNTPIHGSKALGLRTLSGKGSVQFYNWKTADVKAGHRYLLLCHYLTTGTASGAMIAQGDGLPKTTVPLAAARHNWTAAKEELTPAHDGKLALFFQNYAVGKASTLYLKDISVTAP